MTSIITKWGAVIVGLIVIATIVMQFSASMSGISNWFGDNYLPKKYLIIEKYPVRLIVYGQFQDYVRNDNNMSIEEKKGLVTSNLISLIEAIDKIEYRDGNFSAYRVDINVNSDFNSKQIRSSDRSLTTKGMKND